MKTYLVLPELFLKYFSSKDKKVLDKIERTFKKAEEGKVKLLLPEGLFFVLALRLEETGEKGEDIIDYLESILNLHNLKVRNEMILRKTILEMRNKKSFIDAYKSVVIPLLSLEGVYE